MTGNFSVIQEGSTLIKDHKTVVDALEDISGADNLDMAKAIAANALKKIGELPTEGAPNPAKTAEQMVTREQES